MIGGDQRPSPKIQSYVLSLLSLSNSTIPTFIGYCRHTGSLNCPYLPTGCQHGIAEKADSAQAARLLGT